MAKRPTTQRRPRNKIKKMREEKVARDAEKKRLRALKRRSLQNIAKDKGPRKGGVY